MARSSLVGGRDSTGFSLPLVELYDPATNTWAIVGALNIPRTNHTATLLPNGKVLVVGGRDNSGSGQPLVELYDPPTNSWAIIGSLLSPCQSYRHAVAQRQGPGGRGQ